MNSHAIHGTYHMRESASRPASGVTRARARRHAPMRPRPNIARIALVVLLLAATATVFVSVTARDVRPQAAAWTGVSVQPSLTLWDLAAAHPVEGLSTAATVELIKAENHLTSATIYPGQTVLVPVQTGTEALVAAR